MELEKTMGAATRPSMGPPGESPLGAAVGRFLVLGKLGAGGMGVVYMAYDPELDRRVALKLLRPGTESRPGDGARARLVREAQALAKLSHPNVVAVHDVGTHGEDVWIAMEFVAGETLRTWAQARPRRWSEVLPILTDMARGVAAAHAAGLVHRDLKPDNVMIGRDGRVRVMDFGLAHGRMLEVSRTEPGPASIDGADLASTLANQAELQPDVAALAQRLTRLGSVVGTPAYMVPEQWRGREAVPATDQFGWSVMAWELLYGERPFVGETPVAISEAVLAGQRRPPPRGPGVPGWLRRLIDRGLADEPAQRWPTMAALLAELERGRTRARSRTAAALLVGVALVGAGVVGYRRWDGAQRVAACEVSGAEIEKVWNEAARQRVRGAFAATGVGYAAITADRVMPWLDERAAAWEKARTEVCLEADVRKAWDADLLSRATWCLEDQRMALTSLADELGRADEATVQKAVTAVASLESVAPCLDEGMLRRQPAPPAHGRETLLDVRLRLSSAQSLGLAGHLKEAAEVATRAREAAEVAIEWPPLLAAARAQESVQLGKTGAYEEAEKAGTLAYFAAARAGAWRVAAEAAMNLVAVVGYHRARHAEGRAWAEHTALALTHAGALAGVMEARRLENLAIVDTAAGAYPEATAQLERAREIRERELGPDHPGLATALNNLGIVHMSTGAIAEARAMFERVLAIREKALGPDHPDVAASLNNLAAALMQLGEIEKVGPLLERALAIQEKALGSDHPQVATSLLNLAVLSSDTAIANADEASYTRAQVLFERAQASQERLLGPDHPDVASTLVNFATLQRARGKNTEALALLGRALAIQEKVLGPGHPAVAMCLNNIAHVHLALQRPGDALPLLERALTIYDGHEGSQDKEANTRLILARALVATGGDRRRALALARSARDTSRERGATGEVEEAEALLAELADKP